MILKGLGIRQTVDNDAANAVLNILTSIVKMNIFFKILKYQNNELLNIKFLDFIILSV